MKYKDEIEICCAGDGPSKSPSIGENVEGGALPLSHWTFGDVEGRLIEAAALWKREEGKGWPFAGDGPWHLIRGEWWDHGAHDPKPIKLGPASRAETGRRDEASRWVADHVAEKDRRLVWLVLGIKAAGHRPEWMRLLRPMGIAHGSEGLRKRYERAVQRVARALNGARVPWVPAGE